MSSILMFSLVATLIHVAVPLDFTDVSTPQFSHALDTLCYQFYSCNNSYYYHHCTNGIITVNARQKSPDSHTIHKVNCYMKLCSNSTLATMTLRNRVLEIDCYTDT